MPVPERPQLRPCLEAYLDEGHPRPVVIRDRLRFAPRPEYLSRHEFLLLSLCDGRRTLRDIQTEAMRRNGHQLLPLDTLTAFLERMEAARLLDGPAFRAFADAPVREPVCVGSYEEDPDNLRRQLADLFTRPDGPGLPRDIPPDGGLRAALIPHIDYERGGAGYGWAFKEVVERTEASLFVIIGTSHLSPYRFTLTRKAFRTPLGVTPTDSGFIDRVVAHYGDGLFEDELRAHLPEWSIELEVVLLQFLYERRRPIRIVPLVVGSFHDSIQSGESPSRSEDIARMAEALRQAEAAAPEPVCYLISGDLAHIGPKFGDPGLPGELVTHSREQDQAILQAAAGGDPEAYFRVISDEGDGRRICGLPPTYVTLLAARPSAGRLLHYGQYVHPGGHESVSFASMAFDR